MKKKRFVYTLLVLVLVISMAMGSGCSLFPVGSQEQQVEVPPKEKEIENPLSSNHEKETEDVNQVIPEHQTVPDVNINDESSWLDETQVITPDTQVILLNEGATGEVILPEDLIDSQETFTMNQIEETLKQDDLGTAIESYVFNIEIGDKHELNDIIKIKFNYNDEDFPEAVDEASHIGALYYDPSVNQWEYTYYEVDTTENTVTLFTDHLSKYAIVTGIDRKVSSKQTLSSQDIQKIISQPVQSDLSDKALITMAISHLNAAFSNTSKFIPDDISQAVIDSKVYQFKTFGEVCKTYSKGSFLVKYVQALNSISDKESYQNRKTIMDLGKDVYDNAVGQLLGNYSSKLAGIGTFFIEKSLNQFIDAAISGNEKAWDDMYKDYYFTVKGGKSLTWWRDQLAVIVEKTPYGESPSQAVHTFVYDYMNQLWSNEAELASLIQERDKLSMGGISEELKRKIVENNLKRMYESRVYPAMEKLRDYNKKMTEIELAKALTQLENELYSDKYFDIYFDLPSEYQGFFTMDNVVTRVGDVHDKYYLSSQESEVYKRVDHHQFYYKPIDVLMSGADLNYVEAIVPVHNGHQSVKAQMSSSLPSYASVHIKIPDNYVEFDIDEEAEKVEETEEEAIEEEEEVVEDEPIKEENPEASNQETEKDTPPTNDIAEATPEDPENVVLNISVVDYDTEKAIETTFEIDGRAYVIYGNSNEITLPKQDKYWIKVTSVGYEYYESVWYYEDIVGQYLSVGLRALQEEEKKNETILRLPVEIRDIVTSDFIPYHLETLANCEFDPYTQELIITGYPINFNVSSDGYLTFEGSGWGKNALKETSVIQLALTPLPETIDNSETDNTPAPPDNPSPPETPSTPATPVEETVIVKLKIVQYHYQTLLNTEKGAKVTINGTHVDYDPSPSYMEIEIPKASSYTFTVTPIDNHTYPSDSTLYNDSKYLILPISETISTSESIVDANFIFITPYSISRRGLEGQSQYRGYYLP